VNGSWGRNIGRCATCGKVCYPTRAEARTVRRKQYPGADMAVYPCGDYYHVGNRTRYGPQDGQDTGAATVCPHPRRPHHETSLGAYEDAQARTRRGEGAFRIYWCPCGGGYCQCRAIERRTA
jgi:hypothetical protein